MIVTLVHIEVLPQYVEQFIRVTRENHEGSVREPGNFRFDVLQDAATLNRFILYEVYESEEAAAVHKMTNHYLNWRDTVAPWMAKPRECVRHKLLFPIKDENA